MDQKTITDIFSQLAGLTATLKSQVDTLSRVETRVEEMLKELGARVHLVNSDIMELKSGFKSLVIRIDQVEPKVEGLIDAKRYNDGAVGVGRVMWPLITSLITAIVVVGIQHIFGVGAAHS